MRPLRTPALVLAALALAACSDTATSPAGEVRQEGLAPVRAAAAGRGIAGEYIVVLNEGANPRRIMGDFKVHPRLVYTDGVVGFAARLTPAQVNALRGHPAVAYLEQDQTGGILATQSGATWGIDRIDQRNRPLSGTYTYNATASNVYAYIIDSGISTSHSNFGGRASNVYDYAGGNGNDCNGHGTHVAGTVGSTTYGVAKGARIRGLRVTNCSGGSSTSIVIAALNWLRTNHVKPAVANMSLGFPLSSTLNTATTNLINAGVFTAVAAGNENQNACNVSPASASGTITVAASNSSDARASFSNYGGCVDVYAPGVSVTSTWPGGGAQALSGTSMSSPHVAGVGALYKATYGDAASSTVVSWIINNSTANVITGNPSGTPNRLLFKGSL